MSADIWRRLDSLQRARDRFYVVQTPEQNDYLVNWNRTHRNAAAWVYYGDNDTTELRVVHSPVFQSVRVPFDENSTTEDVQTFIDLLKLAEVHNV